MSAARNRIEKLIDKMDTAWEDFHDACVGLSEEEMMIPGVCGDWSVRDLTAHVTWWDEEALKHLPLVLEGGTPPRYSDTYGGIDAFNAMKTDEKRHLSLDDVRTDADQTHRRLIAYLESVPVETLKGNAKFTHRLRLDTYGHYPIHAGQIRAWRECPG